MRKFNKDYSLVRFLHAVPGAEAVDIYVNGNNFYKNLRFTEFTPYVYIPNGTYTVEVYAKDERENPLVVEEIQTCSEELFTVAIAVEEDEEGLVLLVIKEDTEILYNNKSKVRFVDLVVGARDANIFIDGEEVFSNIEYTDVTEYAPLSPKIYNIGIESVDTNQLIRRFRIDVNENRIYSFYALGKAPNFQIFQSLDGGTFMN